MMSTETEPDLRWTRPLPQPTELSRPFWDGCRDQRMLIQRCVTCGGTVFIPQPFCPHCLGRELEWMAAAGTGRVVTYTVVWRPQTPAFDVPYVIAVVALDEGVDLLTNLTDVVPDQVSIGMRVQVRFVPMSGEITLPFFAPVTAPAVAAS